MTNIRTRYAATSGGVYHIVPLNGSRVAKTTLCGRTVAKWRTVTDSIIVAPCERCQAVQERRGYARALEIVRSAARVGVRERRG